MAKGSKYDRRKSDRKQKSQDGAGIENLDELSIRDNKGLFIFILFELIMILI